MTRAEYIKIADAIARNNWDEQPTIHYERYTISQFQGTAFDSDYKSYKIQWKEWRATISPVIGASRVIEMVAKRASNNELKAFQILTNVGAPIPSVYQVIHGKDATHMIFMKMMPGSELYSISNESSWVLTAEKLAKIHFLWISRGPLFRGEKSPQEKIGGRPLWAAPRSSFIRLWRGCCPAPWSPGSRG